MRNVLIFISSCMALVLPYVASAGEDARVLKVLESTREFGFGEGRAFRPIPKWHYVMPDSMLMMKQRLSERDIPALLAILQRGNSMAPEDTYNDRYNEAHAAAWGLASLCGKSVAPVVAAVKAGQLDTMALIDHHPLRWIETFSRTPSGCSTQDAGSAAAAEKEIERFIQARRASEQAKHAQRQAIEDETRNRINENGLKMLTPEKSQLTLDQRDEVFRASVKALGLDHEPLTPEQRAMVQTMYENMVLQQGRQPSN